jgi:hypothetical protein
MHLIVPEISLHGVAVIFSASSLVIRAELNASQTRLFVAISLKHLQASPNPTQRCITVTAIRGMLYRPIEAWAGCHLGLEVPMSDIGAHL